jgi:hypothetical protein
MKKIILYTAIVILSGIGFTSCEDMFGDFLDKAPGADLTEEQVFNEWEKTEAYFFDMYNFLPGGLNYISNSWLDAASDLGVMSYSWGGTSTSFNLGNYFSGGAYNEVIFPWEQSYRLIRKVNIFLAKVDSVPLSSDESQAERDAATKLYKAEARFLRAYFYWELVRRYGPVPIITKRLNPNDPELDSFQRPSTIDPCMDFIFSELDTIYPDLMSDNASISQSTTLAGRITQGINLALKSRIALFMASPQYNTTNLPAKWQDAMNIANQFIATFGHKGNGTYGLYSVNGGSLKANDYENAINLPVFQGNNEVIFWRNNGQGDWWQFETPVSFGGYGGLCPSQNLADMYDMANGQSPFAEYDETGAPVYSDATNGIPDGINPASNYADTTPYIGRDPRFEKTILYNGSTWWNQSIDTYDGGKDKPAGNTDATPTSYYNRKYHNQGLTHYRNGGSAYRNWIIIRYAEVLLNYAEARNEYLDAPDAEVYNALQMLRDRVGIAGNLQADRPMTKEQMRNFIRKERAVELSFEEQRWWDLRRWKVAEKALNRPIYGMRINKASDGKFTYTRFKVQDRLFVPKMYLYPIPENEIWKTGMTNNPGW